MTSHVDGFSSKLDIPYNLHIFASDSKKLLDHLGIERAAILGHSMGGMLVKEGVLTQDQENSSLTLDHLENQLHAAGARAQHYLPHRHRASAGQKSPYPANPFPAAK